MSAANAAETAAAPYTRTISSPRFFRNGDKILFFLRDYYGFRYFFISRQALQK
jgi:hypothetical protein